MYYEVHMELEEKMDTTILFLKETLGSIRAGRANPKLVDKLTVEYYGTQTPLNQIANISAPEPRCLLIQPWDASSIKNIEKAIQMSDIGINPTTDGKLIRLAIPQLTEERRKQLIKVVKKEIENAKVALRNERRDANEKLKKLEKNSEITKDDLKQAEEIVQEITNKKIVIIDKVFVEKEKEILEV